MQALDHHPVELHRAPVGILGPGEQLDHGLRVGQRVGRGLKAWLQASIWAGWIRVLPSIPSAAPCAHSAAKVSRSRKLLETLSSTDRPKAEAASTT